MPKLRLHCFAQVHFYIGHIQTSRAYIPLIRLYLSISQNPVNAERCYKYAMPVTAVSFSSANSHLLAVGFYDGSICIVDIRYADMTELMVSERKSSPPIQPIWQIEFLTSNVSTRHFFRVFCFFSFRPVRRHSKL